MEFAKDMIAALRDRVGPGASALPAGRCDWHAISARLQAGHAARLALAGLDRAGSGLPGGSFAAAAGFAEQGSRGVNSTALADGKTPLGKPVGVEDIRLDDGRG